MFRRILSVAMIVTLAVLVVTFLTGREGQFAAAASRLPDQVLNRAQSLRSEVNGRVVILKDIVAVEEPVAPAPVVLEAVKPAAGAVGAKQDAPAPAAPAAPAADDGN
jgi:hypothetical protein